MDAVFNNNWLYKNSLINYPLNYLNNIVDTNGKQFPTNCITDISINASDNVDVFLLTFCKSDKGINATFGIRHNNTDVPILSINTVAPIKSTKVYTLTPINNDLGIYTSGYICFGDLESINNESYIFG